MKGKRDRLVAEFSVIDQTTVLHRRVSGPVFWRLEIELRGWGPDELRKDGTPRTRQPTRTSTVTVEPKDKIHLSDLAPLVSDLVSTEAGEDLHVIGFGRVRAYRRFQ